MIKRISTYLMILGIVQLVGLNLGGIFWLFWASGIRQRKQLSRRWILLVHSLYLGLCAYALGDWLLRPHKEGYLLLYADSVPATRLLVLAFILLLVLIFGLPVIWLMRKDIKGQFIEAGGVYVAPEAGAPSARP
jgi:cbb3-type cytochrome oxidase subunit 3